MLPKIQLLTRFMEELYLYLLLGSISGHLAGHCEKQTGSLLVLARISVWIFLVFLSFYHNCHFVKEMDSL